jgi:hypothetical protein
MYYVDMVQFEDFMDALNFIKGLAIEAVICYTYGQQWLVNADGSLDDFY